MSRFRNRESRVNDQKRICIIVGDQADLANRSVNYVISHLFLNLCFFSRES